MGLVEGRHRHMLDAAELIKNAWISVNPATISKCFVKVKTLPVEMEAQLAAVDGKKRDGTKGPGVKALTATLNTSSSRVHETARRGSTNIECSDLLANLDIAVGEPANEAAIRAAQGWASVEGKDDVVEAMRADAAEDITALLDGRALVGVEVDEEEKEDSSDEGTERGVGTPPAYSELSSHFGVLEKAAEDSGNGDAASHLQRSKMAMVAAHASKPARQADVREFV